MPEDDDVQTKAMLLDVLTADDIDDDDDDDDDDEPA